MRRPNPALTASRPSDLVGDWFVLVAAFDDGDGGRRRHLLRPRRRCSVLDRRREECRNTWRNLKQTNSQNLFSFNNTKAIYLVS